MSNYSDPFELIEAYLNGSLSPQETAEVDERIKTDTTFAEEVSLQRDTYALVGHQLQTTYKARFAAIDKEESQQQTPIKSMAGKSRSMYPMLMKIAAGLLVLFVMSYLVLNRNSHTPNSLAKEYYSPYPDRLIVRSETKTERDILLAQAMDHYSNRRYTDAIVDFEKITVMDGDSNDATTFYLGESYLANKDFGKAVSTLTPLMGSSTYKEIATWHLALTHLKAGEVEQAKELLTQISSESTNAYKDKAAEILSKLK